MNESKAIYYIRNRNSFCDDKDTFSATVYETESGRVISFSGNITVECGLEIYDIDNGNIVKKIDLIGIIASLLP